MLSKLVNVTIRNSLSHSSRKIATSVSPGRWRNYKKSLALAGVVGSLASYDVVFRESENLGEFWPLK
jgi:hypothetical protein